MSSSDQAVDGGTPTRSTRGRLWQMLPVDWGRVAEFTNEPVPAHIKRWWFALGGTPAYLFLIQVTTGLLLAFYYVPDPTHAYESVDAITNVVPFGWFLRSIHMWSANLMVATVLLHMLRVFFSGAYRKPRQLNWWVGLGLLGCTMAFGFTGYSLVYEQLSFWGATVAANLTATVPFVGETMAAFLRGGPEVGGNTLTRLYMLHVALLPVAMVILIGLHIAVLRIHGISELSFEDQEADDESGDGQGRFVEKERFDLTERLGAHERSTVKARFGPIGSVGLKFLAVFMGAGALCAALAAVMNVGPVNLISHEFASSAAIPVNNAPGISQTGDYLGLISSARMIWIMLALVFAAGFFTLLRGHLHGLMIFFTVSVMGGARLVFDLVNGSAAIPALWIALLAVLILGLVFCIRQHRKFIEDPLVKQRFNFFPDHILTEIIIGTLLLFGLTLLSLIFPADLGAKANPALTPEHIKPEWYFFFQFRLLKLTSLSASVVLTGILIVLLLSWPFVDRILEKIAPRRDLSVYIGIVAFLVFLTFTVWEAMV